MKYTFSIFLTYLIFNTTAFCQIEEREGRLLSPTFPGGIVEVSELPPPAIKGTTYIYDSWSLGSVALKANKSIKNVPLKYDLHSNYLELSSDKGIKVIYSEKIKYFEWLNTVGKTETYYNVDGFKSLEEIPGSFFEIIVSGYFILSAIKEVDYISPHYNQALDAGNEEGRYITKEKYFYVNQDNIAQRIPKKKKDLVKIFGDNSSEMETYIKSKKLGIKDRYELKKIFEYFNSTQQIQ